jgi:1-aminocyclopropane-1-carboxylate deaminase
VLADEIVSYWTQHGRGRPLSVCMPGGTCTTALLLEREIRSLLPVVAAGVTKSTTTTEYNLDIDVVVIPCVGDDAYARRQMLALDLATGGIGRTADLPKILRPLSKHSTRTMESSSLSPNQSNSKGKKMDGYFSFGTPDEFLLDTFNEMKEQDVFVDLLYGAPAWSILLQHWYAMEHDDSPIAGRQVMYVHSGGLEGISSQLTRYKHAGLVNAKEIQ